MNQRYYIIFLVILLFSNSTFSQKKDRVSLLITDLQDKKYSDIQKKDKLNEVLSLTYTIQNDSTRNKRFLELSLLFRSISDSLKFRETIKQSLLISEKINDSNSIARCYWRLGDFFYDKANDSSYLYYYSAKEIYRLRNDNHRKARMLFNMANIQSDAKDYTGSEIIITQAIKVFSESKDFGRLYSCYNLLGINYNNLHDYKKAIEYHDKALSYLRKKPPINLLKESRTLK